MSAEETNPSQPTTLPEMPHSDSGDKVGPLPTFGEGSGGDDVTVPHNPDTLYLGATHLRDEKYHQIFRDSNGGPLTSEKIDAFGSQWNAIGEDFDAGRIKKEVADKMRKNLAERYGFRYPVDPTEP